MLNYKSLHTIAHQHHYNFPNISANYYKVIKLIKINRLVTINQANTHSYWYIRDFFSAILKVMIANATNKSISKADMTYLNNRRWGDSDKQHAWYISIGHANDFQPFWEFSGHSPSRVRNLAVDFFLQIPFQTHEANEWACKCTSERTWGSKKKWGEG